MSSYYLKISAQSIKNDEEFFEIIDKLHRRARLFRLNTASFIKANAYLKSAKIYNDEAIAYLKFIKVYNEEDIDKYSNDSKNIYNSLKTKKNICLENMFSHLEIFQDNNHPLLDELKKYIWSDDENPKCVDFILLGIQLEKYILIYQNKSTEADNAHNKLCMEYTLLQTLKNKEN